MAGRSASVSRARIASAFGPWSASRPNASDRSANSTSNPGGLLEPVPVLLEVAGVDHHHVVVGEAVEDAVVQGGAVGTGQDRVLGLADLEAGRVVGEQVLDEIQGLWAPDLELAHVGHVEEAGGGPHRLCSLRSRGVLDGHGVAGERDHLRAQRHVLVVERRLLQCVFSHGRPPMSSMHDGLLDVEPVLRLVEDAGLGPSNTSSVTSSPRCAGRQWRKMASGLGGTHDGAPPGSPGTPPSASPPPPPGPWTPRRRS
jgi:hypothetical protein